jgi:hypothetical protein
VSSVSATAGIGFVESHVGQSAIIPEFQGYPGNNSFVAEISFLETRQNHKESNQVGKEEREPQPCF